MEPKIAILVATHNRSGLLGETLDSILNQTFKNWNCIIVDDYSQDYTEELVSFYLEKERRFSYFRKTGKYRRGLSGTRNYGMDLAKERNFDFIQFFDDDDIMHPRMLELKIRPFLQDSSLDLTICCYKKFHSGDDIKFDLVQTDDRYCNIRTKNLLRDFFVNRINLNSPGPLWKSEIIKKYRFQEDLQYGEERELYLRIFLKEDLKHKAVEYVLFWYRKHIDAITKDFFKDGKVKELSLQKSDDLFLNELFRQKKIPFFILKSLVNRAVKRRDKYLQKKLWDHHQKEGDRSQINRLQFLILFLVFQIRWRRL